MKAKRFAETRKAPIQKAMVWLLKHEKATISRVVIPGGFLTPNGYHQIGGCALYGAKLIFGGPKIYEEKCKYWLVNVACGLSSAGQKRVPNPYWELRDGDAETGET